MGIKSWIRNWLWAPTESGADQPMSMKSTPSTGKSQFKHKSEFTTDLCGMHFIVYSASGGKIIKFEHYDEQTDRRNSKLYIISEDGDIAKQISEIITVECLRRS